MLRQLLFWGLASCLATTATAQVTINWGTAFVPQKMIESDGSAINVALYTMELGGFQSTFTPTAENISDWEANWMVFDAAHIKVDGDDPNARYAGGDTLEVGQTSASPDASPSHIFTAGKQAYVWVYNQKTQFSTSQWALYADSSGTASDSTPAWKFPQVSGAPQTPLSWFISSADTAIIGAVNGGSGAGGATGGGTFSDGSNDFILRTHQPFPIPEPGVASLAILASALLAFRRRR